MRIRKKLLLAFLLVLLPVLLGGALILLESYRAQKQQVLQRVLRMKGTALEGAWRRLQAGSYGICQGCGEPIPEKRLKAVPYAAFCLPCQERREK